MVKRRIRNAKRDRLLPEKKEDIDCSLGYYKRRIITTRRAIEVDVSRGEEGSYEYTLFDKYKRYSKDFKEAVIESLLLGHFTRKARRFFQKIYGKDCISQTFC